MEGSTKTHSNETITPTLNPLPVDRAPPLRGPACLQRLMERGVGRSNPYRRYSGSCEAAVLGRVIFYGLMSGTVAPYL